LFYEIILRARTLPPWFIDTQYQDEQVRSSGDGTRGGRKGN
jgi:hypothetical protein